MIFHIKIKPHLPGCSEDFPKDQLEKTSFNNLCGDMVQNLSTKRERILMFGGHLPSTIKREQDMEKEEAQNDHLQLLLDLLLGLP